MNISQAIEALVSYAIGKEWIQERDRNWAVNSLLTLLKEDDFHPEPLKKESSLEEILYQLRKDARNKNLIDDSIYLADQFDAALIGLLLPRPSEVQRHFEDLRRKSPEMATDWYYQFSQDSNYIRKARIEKDEKWIVDSEFGPMEITINLSKPEKDPKEIAAAKNAPGSGYPLCALCAENEGYAGRIDHPARQNHRIIPIEIQNEQWYLQYSPYVYYDEHCILLNGSHTPMRIFPDTFEKLFDFTDQFEHYFIGSNADLPIVGGSILAHEHFQGGRHTFPMEKAEIAIPYRFDQYPDIEAGIVHWPLSVLRLKGQDRKRITSLAAAILENWRSYNDPSQGILSESDGISHNTITPIARKKNGQYEMDLVFRNNRTDETYPDGIFHPHAEIHPIKKENIGLIEVMGLAVLPARLKGELREIAELLYEGQNLEQYPNLQKHHPWVENLKKKTQLPKENPEEIEKVLRMEAGKMFVEGLKHCGVFGQTAQGKQAFLRFLDTI